MSDVVLVAIIVALPPTLAAVLTYLKVDKVVKKADQIHDLTNSNLTAVKAELAAAKDMIARLTKELGA